jgi:CDP-paratose 2-epimerase
VSEITGRELQWRYDERNRIGDHIWWVGSNARFAEHYPTWRQEYDVRRILEELHAANLEHWRA